MADLAKNDLRKLFTLPVIRADKASEKSGLRICGSALLVDSGACGLFLLSTSHVFDNLNATYFTVVDNKLLALTGNSGLGNSEQRNIVDIDYSLCLINISGDLADLLAMNFLVFPHKVFEDEEEVHVKDLFIQGNTGSLHDGSTLNSEIRFTAFRYHTSEAKQAVYSEYKIDSTKYLILNYHRFSVSNRQGRVENPNPLDLRGSGIWKKTSDGGVTLLGIVTNSADNYLIGTSIHLYYRYIKDFTNFRNKMNQIGECFN